MSFIYHKSHKVPTWISIRTDLRTGEKIAEKIMKQLPSQTVHKFVWPAVTFVSTIKSMAWHGWSHEVCKTMPFYISRDFLMVSISKHLGDRKRLTGETIAPHHTLNRLISTEDDYTRIFDDVLELENDISLSQIFDIGTLCYAKNPPVQTYITIGHTSKNLLHRLSNHVITVGGDDADIKLNEHGHEEAVKKIIEKIN